MGARAKGLLGLLVALPLGALLLAALSPGRPKTPPVPPPPKPPFPPCSGEGCLHPLTGGYAFVKSLPDAPTRERDDLILDALLGGFAPPLRWAPLTSHLGGHEVTFYVTEDALAVGTAEDWVRVNVRHDTAQRLADYYGALLPTTKIADLAWLASNNPGNTRLRAHTQVPDEKMADTSRMLAHHDAIDGERAGRGGLVRTVGKDFILTNMLVGHADKLAQYGWHDKKAGYVGPGGLPVWQPPALSHGVEHTDYSLHVTLVHPVCVLDGVERSTGSVLMDPELAPLLSHEGVLKLLRHPAVPGAIV